MFVTSLTIALCLTQAAPAASTPAPTETTSADRAAMAAEKAAEAAQKAAEAVSRIADAMAPAPAPAEAAAPPADEKNNRWVGNLGLGVAFITGNSQTLTLTANAAADRRWDGWLLGLRVSGAYGSANPDTNVATNQAATTARRAAASLRGDRAFGEGFASIFALGGFEFDHMKNVESRTIGELGTGLTFFNRKEGDFEKLYLRLDLAARGGYETRFQYFPFEGAVKDPGVAILAPRVALAFRWGFSKHVRFTEEIEFIPFLLQPTTGRLLINNNTRLSARLTDSWALTTGVVVNYDSTPPVGAGGLTRKSTDVALTVGLEATF